MLSERIHARCLASDDRLAAEEVRHVLHVELEAAVINLREGYRHVRVLHEPEVQLHLEHARADLGALPPARIVHERFVRRLHRHDEGGPVEHLVVLQVVHESRRCLTELFEHEDRRPGDPGTLGLVQHLADVALAATDAVGNEHPATAPRLHLGHEQHTDREGEPATMRHLDEVGPEEAQFDHEQRAAHEESEAPAPLPAVREHPEEDQRGDRHRHGDGDAVRRSEVRRRAEPEHQADTGDHEHPVHERHVDLPSVLPRGVADGDAREIVQLHGLRGQGEHTRDECLRGNDCCEGREDHHRQRERIGRHPEEHTLDGLGVLQQEGALTPVVEQQ